MNLLRWLLEQFSKDALAHFQRQIEGAMAEKSPRSERLRRYHDRLSLPRVWQTMPPPVRPSRDDIRIYGDYLSRIGPKNRILILGTTPEIRDLLVASGIENYLVADFSFWKIWMSIQLCQKALPEKEIWIKSDWLTLPLAPGSLDVILGDLVLWQFTPDQQSEFLEKAARLLHKGGTFLVRVHTANPSVFDTPAEHIIGESLENLTGDGEMQHRIALVILLGDRLRDPVTQTTDPQKILEVVNAYTSRNDREAEFLKGVERLVRERRDRDHLEYVTQTTEEVETLLKKFFAVVEKQNAQDYKNAECYPIYRLEVE